MSRLGTDGQALTAGYLVTALPLVPGLEHQLPIAVPALVQALELVQVDPPVQPVLEAPLGGLVLALAAAEVSVVVVVTVAGHGANRPRPLARQMQVRTDRPALFSCSGFVSLEGLR